MLGNYLQLCLLAYWPNGLMAHFCKNSLLFFVNKKKIRTFAGDHWFMYPARPCFPWYKVFGGSASVTLLVNNNQDINNYLDDIEISQIS